MMMPPIALCLLSYTDTQTPWHLRYMDDPASLSALAFPHSSGTCRYMNDPKVLAKLGERLGDIDPTAGGGPAAAAAGGAGAAAAAAPVMPSGPEVNDLFDAAK
jgi:hypothetical protein